MRLGEGMGSSPGGNGDGSALEGWGVRAGGRGEEVEV